MMKRETIADTIRAMLDDNPPDATSGGITAAYRAKHGDLPLRWHQTIHDMLADGRLIKGPDGRLRALSRKPRGALRQRGQQRWVGDPPTFKGSKFDAPWEQPPFPSDGYIPPIDPRYYMFALAEPELDQVHRQTFELACAGLNDPNRSKSEKDEIVAIWNLHQARHGLMCTDHAWKINGDPIPQDIPPEYQPDHPQNTHGPLKLYATGCRLHEPDIAKARGAVRSEVYGAKWPAKWFGAWQELNAAGHLLEGLNGAPRETVIRKFAAQYPVVPSY